MTSFHKLALVEREPLKDPRLRPITIGALLFRFSVRKALQMKRKGLAERMLKSNQFSYGTLGGVQLVIMGCIVALYCNPSWCLLEIDYANAHLYCNRENIWEELERDPYFHFLIHIFLYLYGENNTPLWHFGNGPDQPLTSIHWQGLALRQGETIASVFVNILAARFYRAFMKILGDRSVLFAIADDERLPDPLVFWQRL